MPDRYSEVYGVDARHENVAFGVDFRPTTLAEQSIMGGDRVNKPVGDATSARPAFETTGGRGLTDTEAAIRLGANGRKN